ncbi:hypothetical protein PTSG_02434 [Salpingoeca rosetta]|uniref:GPI mannosyltransferase 1 n=1 Tax=Salpingoeca rosetta (strain ATCC 50818 / BSB-021) TaxID=946362 RepID=F2U271_SALR5|nr:uncharacterized protein PTSG_02434 [Salpingoeca rosetta]EGD81723.1 hypothetical protein PTSG_02434 [Salpingoeca rosetta]|eukprot:XP_004996927.1 hypothetical protein PTSG_02434 [Salpingoeca rosetta]
MASGKEGVLWLRRKEGALSRRAVLGMASAVALVARVALILVSVYVWEDGSKDPARPGNSEGSAGGSGIDAAQHTTSGPGRVQYTDVDYHVFTDAARHVWLGQSPFLRHTYRYTPLLAFLCLPNIWLWRPFGKLLFSCADIAVGVLIYHLAPDDEGEHSTVDGKEKEDADVTVTQQPKPHQRNHALHSPPAQSASSAQARALSTADAPASPVPGPSQQQLALLAWLWVLRDARLLPVLLWLFNPITLGVSTRGNAESLILCVVMLCMYAAKKQHHVLAGAALGLAVHLKLYPIIYSLPLFLQASPAAPFWRITAARAKLVVACIGTMALTTTYFYSLYGFEFLHEAYLYHFSRGDIRHNFSVYFYALYLQANTATQLSLWQRLSTFLPQAIVQLSTALRFSRDIVLCAYVQTVLFVAFNKVFTSQYFLWFLPFLCLVIRRVALSTIVAWFAAQGLWLAIAYQIEFLGEPLYLLLFGACGVLFITHLMLVRV